VIAEKWRARHFLIHGLKMGHMAVGIVRNAVFRPYKDTARKECFFLWLSPEVSNGWVTIAEHSLLLAPNEYAVPKIRLTCECKRAIVGE
jgi:hypothetical protein